MFRIHLPRGPVAAFDMGRTEVTFDQYDRFAAATGRSMQADGAWGRGDRTPINLGWSGVTVYAPWLSDPADRGWRRGSRPVINVAWADATAYARWLSDQTGHQYRLPTEAEWEYAARAGTETPFWTGDCIHTDQTNYNGNFDYNDCGAKTGVYREQTLPADGLPANPWGLYEVAGNVFEWVADCWHDSYQGAPTDGSVWGEAAGGDCARRVLRGGGWLYKPRFLRSASRFRFPADVSNSHVGFRFARTP